MVALTPDIYHESLETYVEENREAGRNSTQSKLQECLSSNVLSYYELCSPPQS
jgi:hypothetical protein